MKNTENLRKETKKNILKIQQEKRKHFNLRREKPLKCKFGDFIAKK